MKTNWKILALSAVLSIGLSSCLKESLRGTGSTISEIRNIQKFDAIHINMSATVEYVKDSVNKVEVFAQENLMDVIETDVRSSTLKIQVTPGVWLRRHAPIRVIVHGANPAEVEISGSGEFSSEEKLVVSSLKLDISGSGKIRINDLTTGSLNVDISGSGTVDIDDGTATDVYFGISGSGKLLATDLVCDNADVDISGSGSAYLTINKKLYANISGSGSVYYKGNPSVETRISGSGKIVKL